MNSEKNVLAAKKDARSRQLVVLCHGVGANGEAALQNIAPHLQEALPHAVFIAPDGAEALLDEAPEKREWFKMAGYDPTRLGPAIREAAAPLNELIDQELERHCISDDNYVLVGFSQGAMMVLFIGLRRQVAPRAIIAFSGSLIDPASLMAEIQNCPPVLLCHGEQDDILPAQESRSAAMALRAAGVRVETRFPANIGHWIDNEGFTAARQFLHKTLAT